MNIKVLSLFDGISCGRVALDRASIPIESYYAAEIDKYAIQISEYNYPNIKRLGDVENWRSWNIPWKDIDLILTGFPCQSFSPSGKQLGTKDPRGKLFYTMLDIMEQVQKHNPNVKVLIENVKMKQEFEEYITEQISSRLGNIFKTLINSALVSAQNRNRYYWTNFLVRQPRDKFIFLKDILEDKEFSEFNKVSDNNRVYSISEDERIKHTNHQPKLAMEVIGGAIRGRYDDNMNITQMLEARSDNKSNTLTTVQKDNVVISDCYYRRLTVLECERLQTLPDNYTLVLKDNKQVVSNSQRYKAIGNGWTVDVIAHILGFLDNVLEEDEY